MRSLAAGKSTSKASVEGITPFGIWLLVKNEEFFLGFREYPFFRQASVQDVLDVEFYPPEHLHWPALDCDLEIDSLRHPEKYPLVDKPLRAVPKKTRNHHR